MNQNRIARWLSLCCAVVTVVVGTYWLMRIIQIPFPQAVSSKGLIYYGAASNDAVRSLFGEKSFDPSRLILRGVVITGGQPGKEEGIALIEVDGKPTEAVTIGEMVPPGVRLERIQPDGVTVSYQGRSFTLQQSFDNPSGKNR